MTELWWRNPSNYVKELLHCNESNIIFDYGWIVRRKITNVQEWAELYYGAAGASGSKYRLLICGTQGTVEFKPGRVDPVAVYPTWQYGEDEAVLESYMANNVGNDKELCDDDETDILERPVLGQEHRVIVMNFPALNLGPGKLFIKFIKDLQDEYPDAILHLHGVSVFAMPCRVGFKSFDWEPRNRAAMGEIELPTGKRVNATKSPLQPHKEWIRLFGFLPIDLMEPRNRCIFNIKSARWAAEHFRKDVKISFRPKSTDATTPDANYSPEESMNVFTKGRGKIIPLPGDKFVCNSCSLAVTCKFYREGSVCTVPSSEPKELASFFRSRDTTSIIDGVAAVLQINSNRLEKGLQQTPGVIVFSAGTQRLPNTSLFTVPGLKAETAVIGFDLGGISVSSGSACSSGKVQPSHVLAAMGVGRELAQGAVRLSLGWSTTEADIDLALQAWRKLADALLRGRRNTA